MTNTTARCDHIVALIDACLAEVEASRLPTALFQADSMTTILATAPAA